MFAESIDIPEIFKPENSFDLCGTSPIENSIKRLPRECYLLYFRPSYDDSSNLKPLFTCSKCKKLINDESEKEISSQSHFYCGECEITYYTTCPEEISISKAIKYLIKADYNIDPDNESLNDDYTVTCLHLLEFRDFIEPIDYISLSNYVNNNKNVSRNPEILTWKTELFDNICYVKVNIIKKKIVSVIFYKNNHYFLNCSFKCLKCNKLKIFNIDCIKNKLENQFLKKVNELVLIEEKNN